MNWLSEQYERERHADDLRTAQREAEIERLLRHEKPKGKPKKMRRAVGSKLVEWGERLQETPSPARHSGAPSGAKI